MWHPWRRLRELTHVELRWQDSDHVLGHTQHQPPCITITRGMTQAERRSTLTHELIHLERGPVPDCYSESEELEVRRLTCERLIPIDALVEAMLWSIDDYEIADELWVDVEIVRDRFRFLPAVDQDRVRRALEERWAAEL